MQQGGDAGGQAAIAELIKEATLLSSMRHPNVVWVYGIVLKPMSKDEDDDDDELSDRDQGGASLLQCPNDVRASCSKTPVIPTVLGYPRSQAAKLPLCS